MATGSGQTTKVASLKGHLELVRRSRYEQLSPPAPWRNERPVWVSLPVTLSPADTGQEHLLCFSPPAEGQGNDPSWEAEMVQQLRALPREGQEGLLQSLQCCLEAQDFTSCLTVLQVSGKDKESSTSVQDLLSPLNLDSSLPLGKMLLFRLYGLVLRECASAELVQSHLKTLLDLSPVWFSEREGIALAVGITSVSHLEATWTVLEQLGRTWSLKLRPAATVSQDLVLCWKRVSRTCLLCYGQVALHAGSQALPWVDNIMARIIYYYSCGRYDNALKSSFLVASTMLLRALQRSADAQSYKFTQVPELIQCLLIALQKEPPFLATHFRQRAIMVIAGLSTLRPGLSPALQSRMLQVCLRSLYTLPPPEQLRSTLPSLHSVPDVLRLSAPRAEGPGSAPAMLIEGRVCAQMLYQKSSQALDLLLRKLVLDNNTMDEISFILQHMEPWLESSSTHERQRVTRSIFLLLQYLADTQRLTVGLLLLLWHDEDQATQSHSHQCAYLLLHLLQHKQSVAEFMRLNRLKNVEARTYQESERKLYPVVKALNRNLSVGQHTQLVLTLLQGLSSGGHLRSALASQVLLTIFEDSSIKPEQVMEILKGLSQELPSLKSKNVQVAMLRAMTLLGTQYPQECIEVMFTLSPPSERKLIPLWRALVTTEQLAHKIITLLYTNLKLRPSRELVQPQEQAEVISLLALGTIYELLYVPEFRPTVHWAFAGILLGLLTQMLYLFELGMGQDLSHYQEDILERQPLGPCRTCLEALKGLFWTTGNWEVFAYVKLLQGWELFEHPETYTEGLSLLARAMVQYSCEIKAVLGQAIISMKSYEQRDHNVAIVLVTELLNSPDITLHASRQSMKSILTLGLGNSSQLVQTTSLKGLSSVMIHPKKVSLLQKELVRLLDSFLMPEPQDFVALVALLGEILHHLGARGPRASDIKLLQLLQPLFDDEDEEVRGAAIKLYGEVLHSGKKSRIQLRNQVFQAVVPLLLHLADPCPDVVLKTKFTFLRCATLLKWQFQKELFSRLAWGQGLGAETDIFTYTVESNFGNYHLLLLQGLAYLESPYKSVKLAARKFVGTLLQDYFADICFFLKRDGIKIIRSNFESLGLEEDLDSRRFYRDFQEDLAELSRCTSY
ncbi:maestro heat-like repeat family member 5 [Sorex araneus]|uniref:maestro heat-like repeat family member 5 n=1 Tax=Sorex araneus TaxID=42254 RepID=UPI002433D3C2|nr:maestro heat-like repeat family member 5 [Sorex araneus]